LVLLGGVFHNGLFFYVVGFYTLAMRDYFFVSQNCSFALSTSGFDALQ